MSKIEGPRVAEFFAGIGLTRLGLEHAGLRVAFANDFDPKKREIYVKNFPAEDFLLKDIFEIKHAEIPDTDLAWASFPCIDISLAGGRGGLAGRHSSAYWGFYRIMCELNERRPPLIVLENVVGLLTSSGGRDLYDVIQSLNEIGYRCDMFLIDAVHFTPQSRPRLFIVAAQPINMAPFDDRLLMISVAKPLQIVSYKAAHPGLDWGSFEAQALPERHLALGDIVEDVPSDSTLWWNKERVAHLIDQMSPKHLALLHRLQAGPHVTSATVYRRVRPTGSRAELRADGVAGCLRTPRGGSSRQILLQAGCGSVKVRFMTPREYARLQGVPDSYRIDVPINQALMGFGDAVCVPAVEWLAANVLFPLLSRSSPSAPRARLRVVHEDPHRMAYQLAAR